jgi:hypothetical protein
MGIGEDPLLPEAAELMFAGGHDAGSNFFGALGFDAPHDLVEIR